MADQLTSAMGWEVPPLSGLAALETLNLSHNKIQDLEPRHSEGIAGYSNGLQRRCGAELLVTR